jgi:hypothetical protein
MLRTLFAAIVLLTPAALIGQIPSEITPPPPPGLAQAASHAAGLDMVTVNEVVIGLQGVDGGDSARFNQYRDVTDGLHLYRVRWFGQQLDSGHFLDVIGRNLARDDQDLYLAFGASGVWQARIDYSGIPGRLTYDAMSPYRYQGNGLFTVPAHVNILTVPIVGTTYDGVDAQHNDQLVASYLAQHLAPTGELGSQRNRGAAAIAFRPMSELELALSISQEEKRGTKISYGPLGDRPPRTLNVELPEPTDYTSRDLRFEASWGGPRLGVNLEVAAPQFRNDTPTMVWQSMYFGPDSDGNPLYNNDVILTGPAPARRNVSTFGQRALPPENRALTTLLTVGAIMPMQGRLTFTGSFGQMRQDESLLPYSFSTLGTDWNSLDRLPRLEADGRIETRILGLEYSLRPIRGLGLKAFYRGTSIDNQTPSAQWLYPTQDSANLNGSVTYKNRRINLGYGYDRDRYGVTASYRLPAAMAVLGRARLGLSLERESIDRDFREATTDENIARITFAMTPTARLSLNARYLYGDRSAGPYDWNPAREGYWYTPAEAGTDPDNPRFAFGNHPDLRRFDVSDRRRDQFDFSAGFMATERLNFSLSYGLRNDSFDSDVRPVQPLAGTPFAPATDSTLGVQLGLLANDFQQLTLDATFTPIERWSLTAFISREEIDFDQRGMAFNENTRTNAQGPQIGVPGQSWRDPANYWRGINQDRTNTIGLSTFYHLVPDRWDLTGEIAWSRGTVDYLYSGFGDAAPLGTTYYAFRTPPTARQEQRRANLGLRYNLAERWALGVNYLFDDYEIDSWIQEPEGGWVELVGSEYLARDTTRDNRWGNRLVRLGGVLAPSYTANVLWFTAGYRW